MFGTRILPALADLVTALTEAGVPASLDITRVHPPGAWVHPVQITGLRLDGGATLRAHVFLIARDIGAAQVLTDLGGLLDAALTVVDTSDDEQIDVYASLPLPDSEPLPAFRLTVDLYLEGTA